MNAHDDILAITCPSCENPAEHPDCTMGGALLDGFLSQRKFDNSAAEREKGEKNKEPDNAEFLSAIFHALPDGASATITSFTGNPATTKQWGNYAPVGQIEAPATSNNYFCLSSHYPGNDGVVRRKKVNFAGLHCLMLDDIGSKIPADRVTLAPSWSIESSPGNYQVGFILDEPILQAPAADRLMNAIIAAGLCDPGANGPTARLARLPVAINGKYDGPFQCRLVEWRPDLRYSLETIVEGLQIEMAPAGRPKRQKRNAIPAAETPESANDNDDVYLAAPSENPVIAELKKRALYKMPLGSGKHDITCPWVHEHTDALDTGAAYFEPDDLYPRGGFCCQHSHGHKYKVGALLEFLSVSVVAAKMKATIKVSGGELHRIVDRAEQELARSGKYYQRGGLIASISVDPATGESQIIPTSKPAMTRALSCAAVWQRYDKRSDGWVMCDPPERHCIVLFDAQTYAHMAPLAGIARQPYMRASGHIVSTAGYDTDSAMFGVFDARQFNIPDNPGKADATAALARLSELLNEFSFAAPCDRSAALAMLLTAAIRPSLPHAPMFHVRAPVMGSGKSFLCKLATAVATPAPPSPVSFPDSEEECGKLLLALLLKSPAVIEFDDLNTDLLPFDKLKTSITEGSISGRILGVSKDASVSTRTLFLSSGNNVGPVKDMCRRVLTINIDPMCPTPATRHFKRPNLLNEVRTNRGKFVSDALTIIKAWALAGRPESDVAPLASFSDWSGYCRHSLIWLGLPDPVTTLFAQMSDDPDAELLGRLMKEWADEFGAAAVGVRDLVARAELAPGGELSSVVREIAEERGGGINRNRFGWWIKRHEGRFVDNRRIIPDRAAGGNAKVWRIVSVSSVSSALSSPQPKVSGSLAHTVEVEI
ncbi:MAG: hypothetical protein J0L95_02745 [Candidatus Accumulibacter sp.]|jgi:hypothetical protein|nr:hypothetical protein [Accumulibacter sp.]